MITIEVFSSGFMGTDHAEIGIDNIGIEMDPNESGHFRGLHIVVINPFTGEVEWCQVFDTYKSSKNLNEAINYI